MRLFVRRDTFERFVSCLVFLPRDRFNTANRRAHRARSCARRSARELDDWTLRAAESVLVRIHYLAAPSRASCPTSTTREIEARLVEATRSWDDDLEAALIEEHGEEAGDGAAPPLRRRVPGRPTAPTGCARSAVADISRIEQLRRRRRPRPDALPAARGARRRRCAASSTAPAGRWRSRDVLPMFENMGVTVADERPYEVDARATASRRLDLRLRPRPTRGADESTTDAIRDALPGRLRRASGAARPRTTASTG